MRVGITGHRHLPPAVHELIRGAVKALSSSHSIHGITSLAAGADQIAASEIIRCDGSIEVVIPCHGYESTLGSTTAATLFRDLVERSTDTTNLPFGSPSGEAYLAAGLVVVERSDRLLAVWDGQPARGTGGTATVVAYARARSIPVDIVWPTGLSRE